MPVRARGRVRVWRRSGMKAIENAPPEMNAKSKSGRLLAALKASCSGRLKVRETMNNRPKARALSRPKRKNRSSEARVRWESLFISKTARNDTRLRDGAAGKEQATLFPGCDETTWREADKRLAFSRQPHPKPLPDVWPPPVKARVLRLRVDAVPVPNSARWRD